MERLVVGADGVDIAAPARLTGPARFPGCSARCAPANSTGSVRGLAPSEAHYGMRQMLGRLTVQTGGRGFYDITSQVQGLVTQASLQTGLCTLHLQHTSASLLIQENADPDVRRDFEQFFARLVPDGDPLFVHTIEGEDDMPAHIRAALTAVNLGIPVETGRLTLGMWQGIYVWEHRREPHSRIVVVHVLGM